MDNKNKVPETYTSKTPGRYMLVNAKGKLFIVGRKGRTTNRRNVQLCITDNDVKMWSEYMKYNKKQYPVTVDKETDERIYKLWTGWMREMHDKYYAAETTIL